MASIKFLRVVIALFYTFFGLVAVSSVNGQRNPYNSDGIVDKNDRPANPFSDERSSLFLGRPSYSTFPVMDGQTLDVQREGKLVSGIKFPYSPAQDNSRLLNYRYYLPLGAVRNNKKSERAILLDVGDYITKMNGSPAAPEAPAPMPARPPPGLQIVGGLMRSSGK